MVVLPRGISPELLVSQVKNTMPYLFEGEPQSAVSADVLAELSRFEPVVLLKTLSQLESLSHFQYFQLCVCAHYLTCATPVPTDVDNQIRVKLWPAQLPLEFALQMADFILETQNWNFNLVSRRSTWGALGSPWEKVGLGGHHGEWFTLASGAYCALRRYSGVEALQKCEQLLSAISDQVNRHSEVFGSLWRSQQGVMCLITSANIAHNLGDLDRVMDLWELKQDDPLRLGFYRLGSEPFDSRGKLRFLGRLWVAGQLYQSPIGGSSMASENHRHFALRKPRCLRRDPRFLIPNGPFFDSWGRDVATSLSPSEGSLSEELQEVVSALIHGWKRLPKTVGYARALCGALEIHTGLELGDLTQSRSTRLILKTSQKEFEKIWEVGALRELDEIPSRAKV